MQKIIFILIIITGSVYSQIGTYRFSNTLQTYTPLSGATTFAINGSAGNDNDGYSLPQTIPFTFNFGGTDFTQYVVCSNGFMAFGTSLTSFEYSGSYNVWVYARNDIIAYCARDLQYGTYSKVTEGTAPNRIHKIQCEYFTQLGWIGRNGNCQIWLYETSNKVEIHYGAFSSGTYNTDWDGYCKAGIRGSSNTPPNIMTLGGYSADVWTNPIVDTSVSAKNQYVLMSGAIKPDNGRTYSFFIDNTPMFYVSSTVTQTLTTNVYAGAVNQHMIGIQVVAGGYITPLNLTSFTLNTHGSTNAATDISNAKIYYTGTTGTFGTSNFFGVTNSPNGAFAVNGSQQLAPGTNYFWLTYDVSSGAGIGNIVDAECNQITMSGSGGTQVPSVQAPSGNRQIIAPVTSVNVGTGETFTSLTNSGGLFEAISTNSFFVASNLTVNITSNLNETGAASLNDFQSPYTVTIRSSAAVERLISGSNSSTALINLSGADNIVIDGRVNGSGKFLRFRNTSGTKPTIQFMNDSKKNTVRDCYIESNNTQVSSGLGTILFSTTTVTSGNDSNTIMNCDIRNRSDAAGNPAYGIVCSGNPSGIYNDNITITGCNIYNFNSSSSTYGIYLFTGTGSNCLIENNSIYNTSPISTVLWHAIYINNINSGGQNVLNNFIGGSAPNCGGSALTGSMRTLYGTYFRVNSTSVNNISGNTIKNINIAKNSNTSYPVAFDGIIGFHSVRCNINITNNIMGDTVSNDNINITGSSSSIYSTVFFIVADSVYSGNVNNNIVGSVTVNQPLAATTTSGCSFAGMYFSQGANVSTTTNLSDNKFGSFSVPNSIKAVSSVGTSLSGMYAIFGGTGYYSPAILNCKNNIFVNMTNMPPHSHSNAIDIFEVMGIGGSYVSNTVFNIENNYLYNLSSPWISGMQCSLYDNSSGGSAVGYLNVKNNTVDGLINNNSGSSISSQTSGIIVQGYSDFCDVSGNKISNLVNTETGPSNNGISGLSVRGAYSAPIICKSVVYNNQISITNGEPQDNILPHGENDAFSNSLIITGLEISHGDSTRVYNNSVYIGGIEGSTRSSYCMYVDYYLGTNVKMEIRNNLLVNNRIGSDKHYCVFVENTGSSWTPSSFNYNTYITRDASEIGYWGGIDCSFDQWKTNTQGEKQSWSAGTTEIDPLNLFIDAAGGNLNINYSNPEAWIVSGKGLPLSYVSSDYDGNSRPTIVLYNQPTDIGSDEFTQTPPNNPSAIETGTPGAGNTTTYKLYGRTIMQIDWGIGGTSYPAGMNVKYNSCLQPPGITGGYGYSYWNVTPNGTLSGAAYDITINFGDNETHSITFPSLNTRLAKKDAQWVAYTALGTGNLETELDWSNLRVKVRGLNSFSDFALIDNSNPLPVNICSFSAGIISRNVTLNWETCTELNNAGFEVERRVVNPVTKQFGEWQKTGFITGHGTTNEPKSYSYEDRKLFTGKYQYRLKQVDFNGNFEYYQLSNPEIIEIGKPNSFAMSQNYPNPSNPSSKIDYQIPFNGKVNLAVYDILGREVFKLVKDEIKEAGYYTAEFNGSSLASGVYFYRIITEGDGQHFSKTLKLIVVK